VTELRGNEAIEFHERLRAEELRRRADSLARAKQDAVVRGREPFDLTKLEQLCDTSRDGVVDPPEVRAAHFEYMYYVHHPEFTTMEDLAQHVERISRW
jgi:hypothetical protein